MSDGYCRALSRRFAGPRLELHNECEETLFRSNRQTTYPTHLKALTIPTSAVGSTAAVASSQSMMCGSFNNALAIAIR